MFLRPRRMGKSVLASMLEHYYDLSLSDRFDELFGGLWVHAHPTPEKNRYLVLSLDFSRVATDRGADVVLSTFYRAIRDPVDDLLARYGEKIPEIKSGTATGAIGRVFITGITPILLDDLSSGFNILTLISQHLWR